MSEVIASAYIGQFIDINDDTKTFQLSLTNASTGTTTIFNADSTVNRTISLPDATTTLVGIDTIDTLTNKTLDNVIVNGVVTAMPYFNSTYVSTSGKSGGMAINYKATAVTDTVASGGFTNAVDSTVNTTGSSTFSAGDIIQITDANNPTNNGLFEVLSHSSNVLTITGTPTYDNFQSTFVTDSTVAGNITKINLSVMRADPTTGAWATAQGSSTPLTFTTIGSVQQVNTGTGLNGGPITNTGTISLANTAVTAGSYTLTNLTVDAQGRLTAASNGVAVTQVNSGTGLTGGPITTTGTISLANTAVTAGSYTLTNITVDAQGRLTAASNGTAVTQVNTGTGLTGGPITTTGTVSIANTGVTAGAYTSPNLTINAQGQITVATNGPSFSVGGAIATDVLTFNGTNWVPSGTTNNIRAGNATFNNNLSLNGSTSGTVTIAPASTTTSYTVTMMNANAPSGTTLIGSTNTGASTSTLSYVTIGSGLTYSSGTLSTTFSTRRINLTGVQYIASDAATTILYWPYDSASYGVSGTFNVITWVVPSNRTLVITVKNGATTLGTTTVPVAGSPALVTFSCTKPAADARIDIIINKGTNGGTAPSLFGMTVEF